MYFLRAASAALFFFMPPTLLLTEINQEGVSHEKAIVGSHYSSSDYGLRG